MVHPYTLENFGEAKPSRWFELFQGTNRSDPIEMGVEQEQEQDLGDGLEQNITPKMALSLPQNSSNSIFPTIDSTAAVFTSDYVSADQANTPEAIALNQGINRELMETIEQNDNFITNCFMWIGC